MFCNSFTTMKMLRSSQKYIDIYKNINPILTDVSLSDGWKIKMPKDFSFMKMRDLFHEIMYVEKPNKIDVGPFIGKSVLPVMGDNQQLFHYAGSFKNVYNDSKLPIYSGTLDIGVLVPSYDGLEEALKHNVHHMSFLSSCSNGYQKQFFKKSIEETKDDLDDIFAVLKKPENQHITKKLYISCVDECPISGRIDNDLILHEIFRYNTKYDLDEICLVDTCGSLKFDNYKYIVDTLIYFGISRTKLAIKLHVDTSNKYEMAQIVRYSLQNKITRFDVSVLLHADNCPITGQRRKPIMCYDFFYGCLKNEIISQYEREL